MATAVSTEVRQAILSEMGMDDCRIVDLLNGCYGNTAYMQGSYGITAERCISLTTAIQEEMPEYIKTETGQDVTAKEIYAVMRDAYSEIEELWDERIMGYGF